METKIHSHHSEESLLREHRLAFDGPPAGEAPPVGPVAPAGPEAPPVGPVAPAADAAAAGEKKVGEADKGAKKEQAAIDQVTEKFGTKIDAGADAIVSDDLTVTKGEVMKHTKTELLAILKEELAGKMMPNSPEKISSQIMQEVAKSMKGVTFDRAKPEEYIAKVKVEAERLIRTHPDIVRETSAADKEKGVETPLTPKELGDAKKLLSDGTLKQMHEFLAKGDAGTQKELTKLWLGANGYSVDDAVGELKAENLTLENTHKVDGLAKLINMAVLAFTAIHLLKKKGEELKKKVEDGVQDATGEGGKPAEVSKETLEKKIATVNAAQTGQKISLDKDELRIEPTSPREAEFLQRVLEEHPELGFDGRVGVGTNAASFVLSPNQIDKLSTLLSGEGRKKEELVQTLGLKPGKDGTYTRDTYEGTYTFLPNGNVYWSGGKGPAGNPLPPSTYIDGAWKQQQSVPVPSLDDVVQFWQYLDMELARAKNIPQAGRTEIVEKLESLARTTDLSAKNLREQLQLAPSNNENQNRLTLLKAQSYDMQSTGVRKTIDEIKGIKVQ